MNRHIVGPPIGPPSVKPTIVFSDIDVNKDGNVTEKEMDAYNKLENRTVLIYDEPTQTFSYIMIAVVLLCAGSMAYEILKVKKEKKDHK